MKNLFILLALMFSTFVYSQTKPTTQQKPEKKSTVIASFGKHKGSSEITIEELQSLQSMSLSAPGSSKNYVVVSYEVTIKGGGILKSAVVQGPALSTEAKNLFTSCSNSTVIFIDDIKIKDESGKLGKAAGITLLVK